MRLFGYLMLAFLVSVVFLIAVNVIYAVLNALSGAEQSFVAGNPDTAWFTETKESFSQMVLSIEVGLIIALVAMVIGIFVYSRRR